MAEKQSPAKIENWQHQLLSLEATGQTTPEQQQRITQLRADGMFPPALSLASAPPPAEGPFTATPPRGPDYIPAGPPQPLSNSLLNTIPNDAPAMAAGMVLPPGLAIPGVAAASAANYGVRSLAGMPPEGGLGGNVTRDTALYGVLPEAVGAGAKVLPWMLRRGGQALEAASIPAFLTSLFRGNADQALLSATAKPVGRMAQALVGPAESLVGMGARVNTDVIQHGLSLWEGAFTSAPELKAMAKLAADPAKLGPLLDTPFIQRALPAHVITDLRALWKSALPSTTAVLTRRAATMVPGAAISAGGLVPPFTPADAISGAASFLGY